MSWQPESERHTESVVERLLADCLELEPAQRGQKLELLCAANPSHASDLREFYSRLERVGLTGAADADEVAFPDRLGDFRLLQRLGGGGMGVVYLAEQESFGRKVALKLMQPTQLYFPHARERFRREVQAIATLKHPGIVTVFACGEEQGIPYLAMEWIEGLTLAQLLDRLRTRRPEKLNAMSLGLELGGTETALFTGSWSQACLRIAIAIAEALEHAHAAGVVHRDVKPSNVMLTPAGRVYLLDFGLAHFTGNGEQAMTRSGTQPGSLPYMSPEQVRGERGDQCSDGYSLGVLLYEALTLELPYLGCTAEATRQAVLEGVPTPVRACNRTVPRDAEVVCHQAMELRRSHRYASVSALREDLGNVLAQRPIRARPQGPLRRAGKWASRHPGVAVLGSLLLLVLSVSLGLTLQQNHDLRQTRDALRLSDDQHRGAVERLLRLSDETRLSRLLADLQDLRPVRAENEADYVQWIAAAEELQGRLALHEQTLLSLGGDADAVAGDPLHRQRAGFTEQAWEREHLTELVAGLRRLDDADHGQLSLMRKRLAAARTLHAQTIVEPAAAWQRAAAAVAADPRFQGLELRPQLGLLPLGADPDSGLEEFLHLLTHEGPVPRRDKRGRLAFGAATGIVLVLLPGGTFWMGTQSQNAEQPNYDPDPRREIGLDRVTLDPFLLGKYEVTRGQWWRACRDPAARYKDKKFTLPMPWMDWPVADRTLRQLDLCLPTEAQWEFGCRAGAQTIWFTGDQPESLQHFANLMGTEHNPGVSRTVPWNDGHTSASPVGSFRSNGFGLHDMQGNLTEWCRDDGVDFRTLPAAPGDGCRGVGKTGLRISRGGSWKCEFPMASSAVRFSSPIGHVMDTLGVRAGRSLDR